jgi:hypothetical protein
MSTEEGTLAALQLGHLSNSPFFIGPCIKPFDSAMLKFALLRASITSKKIIKHVLAGLNKSRLFQTRG